MASSSEQAANETPATAKFITPTTALALYDPRLLDDPTVFAPIGMTQVAKTLGNFARSLSRGKGGARLWSMLAASMQEYVPEGMREDLAGHLSEALMLRGRRRTAANKYLSVPQVAEELGVTAPTVRGWIGAEELPAENLAEPGKRPLYRVSREELDLFLQRRRTRGAAGVPDPGAEAARVLGLLEDRARRRM